MTLKEGFKACRDGNFISHPSFDHTQSMHYFRDSYYYEDGAILMRHMDWFESQEWAKDGWYIKYEASRVDLPLLNALHLLGKAYMFSKRSYEECILKGAING